MMKPIWSLFQTFVILTISCIAWIMITVLFAVQVLGGSLFAGGIITASLTVVTIVLVGVFYYEVRHAYDLTDKLHSGPSHLRPQAGNRSSSKSRFSSSSPGSRPQMRVEY